MNKNIYLSFLLLIIIPFSVVESALAQNRFSDRSRQELSQNHNIIYVNPYNGSDKEGKGSSIYPFKTITQALSVAPSNGIISLARGTYNSSTGEVFPLVIDKNIIFKGDNPAKGTTVTIQGGGWYTSPTGGLQNVAIVATKSTQAISGITVINPHNSGYGLLLESASTMVTNNRFIRNRNSGVLVTGSSNARISNNHFSDNGVNGLLLKDNSKLDLLENEFQKNSFGITLVGNSQAVLRGNQFLGNDVGVMMKANAKGILRNNRFENSGESGLVLEGNSQVDIGIRNNPGNNTFLGNRITDIDNRNQNEVISAYGNQLAGATNGRINFNSVTSNIPIIPNHSLVNNSLSNVSLGDNSGLQRAFPIAARGENINLTSQNLHRNSNRNTIAQSRRDLPPLPPPPPGSRVIDIIAPSAEDNLNIPSNNSNNSNFNNSNNNGSTLPPPPVISSPTNRNSSTSQGINNSNDGRRNLSEILIIQPESRGNINQTYRVMVSVSNKIQERRVRSLYPDVFNSVYNGRRVLQIGLFSDVKNVDEVKQNLLNMGLNPIIVLEK